MDNGTYQVMWTKLATSNDPNDWADEVGNQDILDLCLASST